MKKPKPHVEPEEVLEATETEAASLPQGITYIAKYKKFHVEQPGTKINLGMFADLESAKHALATYKD